MPDTASPPPSASHRHGMTTEIVAAYVSHNNLPAAELASLIHSVHEALVSVASRPVAVPEPEPLKPAVPIRTSVHDEFIVCLENGKRFKSLKRHLFTAYGLTPEQYRDRWGLPKTYPMVAPAYAQTRSSLARQIGLGRKSQGAPPDPSTSDGMVVPPAETGTGTVRSAKPRRPAGA